MPEISILLLGDCNRPEFSGARSTLESSGRVAYFAELDAAVRALETDQTSPDVIVIAQSYPRQFSHQAIDRLRRLAPLSRILGLLGSWCEGEVRSGQPWPAAVRIYWHQWNCRASRELHRLVENGCPSWGLPLTATDEERLLQNTQQKHPAKSGLIAVHACESIMEDLLTSTCRMWGYSTVSVRPPHTMAGDCPDFCASKNGTVPFGASHYARIEGAVAAIFVGSTMHDEELDQLRHFINTIGQTPVIVLLDFPRIEDQHLALSAGAAAVMSKPLNIDDLAWQLEQLETIGGSSINCK
jgi:DNA-binding NarL/FixJ family response regulator